MFILKIFTYVNIYLIQNIKKLSNGFYFSLQANAQSTPPLIRAISCDMDILAQTNDTLIVSNVWFSKEFPEFIRYGKVGL